MIYLDAAYIAKFYVNEPESERIRKFLESAQQAASCVHAIAEVASVFQRKLREGTMPRADFDFFCAQFDADCQAGLWTWLSMPESLVHLARKKINELPPAIFIRASDALHLTCAAEAGCGAIYTNDRHMLAAAPAFGLKTETL